MSMSPSRIQKLVKQGRLIPIIKNTDDGKTYLLGYRRKNLSRKTDSYMLPEPELVDFSQYSTKPF